MKSEPNNHSPLTPELICQRTANGHLEEILQATRAAHEYAAMLRIIPLASPGADGIKMNLAYIRAQCERSIQEINDLIEEVDSGKIVEDDFRHGRRPAPEA